MNGQVPGQGERVHKKTQPIARRINASGEMIHALCGRGEARQFGCLALKFREERKRRRIGLVTGCENVGVGKRGWSGLSEI